jgi:hypothetical protein
MATEKGPDGKVYDLLFISSISVRMRQSQENVG